MENATVENAKKRADFPEFPRPSGRDHDKKRDYDEMSFRDAPVGGK